MMEKIKDAIKEERRTSDTPYCCVDSIKCNENAIPGSTLTTWWSTYRSKSGPRAYRGGHQRGKKGNDDDDDRKTYLAKKTRAVAGSTL
jgi:hypothetical protein